MIRSNQIHSLDASKVTTSNERTFVTAEQLEKLISLKKAVEVCDSINSLPIPGASEVIYIVKTKNGGDMFYYDEGYVKITGLSSSGSTEGVPSITDIDLTNIESSIIPSLPSNFDLGSPNRRFRNLYVDDAYLSANSLYIGDVPVLGLDKENVLMKAASDKDFIIKTFGTGNTLIQSENNIELTSKSIVLDGDTTANSLSVKNSFIEINCNNESEDDLAKDVGIKINRGDLEDYFILLDEETGNLKIGHKSSLKNVATREWALEKIYNNPDLMKKSTYDKNNNGIVDKAETLDGLKTTIEELNYVTKAKSNIQEQLDDRYTKSEVTNLIKNDYLANYYTKEEISAAIEENKHIHENKDVLDKITADEEGKLYFDGNVIEIDDRELKKEIGINADAIEELRLQTRVGEQLDYGFFRPSKNIVNLREKDRFFFDEKINGSIEIKDGYLRLKSNRTYNINSTIRITGKSEGSIMLKLVDTVTDKVVSNIMTASSSNVYSHYNYLSTLNTIIETGNQDMLIAFEVHYAVDMDSITTHSNVSVLEVGRYYIENEVKSVDLKDGIQDNPVGSIISHIGLKAPKHYLICDGSEYKIADYPKLAEHFLKDLGSVNYFGGNGVTTFAVPDMRGEFMRGYDNESIRDPEGAERSIGKHQDATEHANLYSADYGNLLYVGLDNKARNTTIKEDCTISTRIEYASLDSSIKKDEEEFVARYTSRPTNVSVLFCIKCEPTYYMEYYPRQACFEKDILSNARISSTGQYSLSRSILEYDFIYIERCKSDNTFLEPIVVNGKNGSYEMQGYSFSLSGNSINIKTLADTIVSIVGIKGSVEKIEGNPPPCESVSEKEFRNIMNDIMGVFE